MSMPGLSTGTIAARLNRMPITRLHFRMIVALSLIFLFELGDLNTFSYATPGLIKYWNLSVSSVGVIVSASFFRHVSWGLAWWLVLRLGRPPQGIDMVHCVLFYHVTCKRFYNRYNRISHCKISDRNWNAGHVCDRTHLHQ